MPGMDRPPLPPQAAAQMGGGLGPGIAEAQQQQGKGPEEIAVGTVEKILGGLQNTAFRPFVQKALATLNAGLKQIQAQGPESKPMAPPPNANAPGAGAAGPPVAGPMSA